MWHCIALALGGRTIAEWKSAMTRVEFLEWVEMFKLFPFDDHSRLYRPAALISRSMGGGEIGDYLEWLQPDPSNKDMNDADLTTLRTFGYKKKPGKE